MSEEYEIIFITEEGRAIKNNKTGKIYHSEFEIIDEKNKEIDKLNKEYERIYNENCKLRENHNINDITLLDENERLNNIINELEKELREGSFDVYFCSTNAQKTFKSNEIIIKSLILDKLKELKENNK